MNASTSLPRTLRRWLPVGEVLPEDEWQGRHKGFVVFLALQSVGLFVFGLIRGFGLVHSLAESGIVAGAAAVALLPRASRRFRSVVVTLGLMTASGILVHFSGGTIEAHFHFFVMVILVTLYQSWVPFLLSIAYVVVHHGVMGSLDPDSVYNHAAAIERPFLWAFIHGMFILGASAAGLIVWKRNEELRAREQEHLSLTRALDNFAAWVAHDLKTPLAAIKGAARAAIKEDPEGVMRRELFEVIDRQTDRATDLVTNLLQLSRASGTPRLETIDFPELLGELKNDFASVPLQIDGVPAEIVADRTALKQALANLIDNAARYGVGGDGRAQVAISARPDRGGCKILVSDRGPGLDVREAQAVFEPFNRLGTTDQPGTGLGLSIVSATARAHGGEAGFEPRPGGGSTFWVLIPEPTGVPASHRG